MKYTQSWRMTALALALATALGSCTTATPEPEADALPRIDEPGVPKQLQSRQIIVALAERVRPQWPAIARELQARYQLRPVGEFPLASIGVQCLVYQVPAGQAVDTVLTALRADPRVELAQPNQGFEALQAAPDDAYAALVYGAKLVQVDRVQRISTGQGVTVAIIDTGADTDHPDLRGRISETATFVEGGEPSFRQDRHGTAIASIIGARADGNGLDGIAPEARLSVLKACWYPEPNAVKARCSSWTLAKAVDHAIRHEARIINLSLGGRADALLTRLLEAADQRNITVVVATLENAHDPGFPASLSSVIPAIACDARGRVAAPHWPDISFAAAAPGIDVVAPVPPAGYTLLSGSSLAAAHVSGVIALLLQQTPQATPAQIKAVLRATARPVVGTSPDTAPAIGLIDACAALNRQALQLACP